MTAMEQELFGKLQSARPFFVFAGPCVVESRDHAFKMAHQLRRISDNLGIPFVYKSSFDKANRTSGASFRGMGMEEGLKILSEVRERFGLPIVTDIHESYQAPIAAKYVDVLQIPAFLCRQTDLLLAAAETGKIVNIKKGQFADANMMVHAAQKVIGQGNPRVMLCERGTSFGYGDLIVDARNLVRMREAGVPVVMDVTHAVQQPGGHGSHSGGLRQFVPTVARTAVAVGVDGLFFEVHDNPNQALSDGPNCWPVQYFEELLTELKAISEATRGKSNPIPDCSKLPALEID